MSWNILPKNVLQYFLEKIKSKFMLIWNHDILGAKNILPFPYTYGSGTSHGLTITVNDDGSITAQGVPTETISFLIRYNIIEDLSLWQGSEMIFSEWEVQNQNAFAALLLGQSTPISEVRGDYKLTVTSEMIQQGVAFILYFGNGVDLTTPITFKPMVRLATDPDHTWRSPALTNKQLTDSVFYLSYAKSHVSANPSTTTGVLSGLEIDGVGYAVQGGDVSGKYDKITQSGVGSCICDGQSEYFKIATLTITETNINGPIGFEVSQTFNQVTLLQIGFAKTDNTDPDVAWFYTNQRNNYWIVKESTSFWGLYGQFENTVDGCSLHRIVGYRVNNGVTVTVNLTNVSALPSGATQPTYGGSVNYANIANRAASATDSTKVAKAGDTMSGRLNFSNVNTAEMNFRTGHNNYDGVVSYQTDGNEAWLFTTKNGVTSIMFVNGEDTITNASGSRWKSLVPGLQIKNNKVAIGKLIPDGTTPTHALDVSGTAFISGASDTPLRLKRNSDTGACYMEFSNNSGVLGYFAVSSDKKPYFEPGGGSDVRIPLQSEIDQKNFIKDVGNNVNTTFAYSKAGLGLSDFTWLAGWNGYELRAVDKAHFLKVTQTNTTGSASYRLLYSSTADDTTRTEGVRKGRIYFNPSNGMLWADNGTDQFQIGNNYLYLKGKITLIQTGNQQLTISATTSAGTETNYRVALGVFNNSWAFKPFTDKSLTLGQSGERWGQIYSSNSAISTSDRKEKKDIVSLDEFARTLIMSLNPVSYKFKDGKSGRTHYGMIAQDVEDSLEELGITAIDIAAFCKDKKLKDIPVFSGQRDSNGNPIYDKKQVPIPGEYTYGLRYEEFIAPIIKTEQLQQEDINSLKEEIVLLKEEIALLKQRLQILEDK